MLQREMIVLMGGKKALLLFQLVDHPVIMLDAILPKSQVPYSRVCEIMIGYQKGNFSG